MKKVIAILLVLTGSLCASNNYGLTILNKKKTKGEPTYAIIGNQNNKQLKVYNGPVSTKSINEYSKEYGLTSLAIDKCTISNLEKYSGITTLVITNSKIEACTQNACKGLINLTITSSKITLKVDEHLKNIRQNDNIIIRNNDLIEDANNNTDN